MSEINISTLRKSRVSNLSDLADKFENKPQQQSSNERDSRYWSLEADKAGNGSAVIRFLPNIEGDAYNAPYITKYSFAFQGPTGKWYIEQSLKTIGQEDPCLQHVNSLWASKIPANIELAKSRRQSTRYVSNILVVSDPKHPENEGKVFMFQYGKAIYNKLLGKLKPTFEDDEPINPFDLWEGCNFKFRMRKKDGYANYDDSTFSDVGPVGDDDFIVKIMKQRHDLSELINPSNFKSYDALKTRLESVLTADSFTNQTAEELMEDVPSFSAPEPKSKSAPVTKQVSNPFTDDDDDDALDYFKSLANDD